MLQKFKRIKDRQFFYRLLSKATGCEYTSIEKNWFKKMFCAVPKPYLEITNKEIDNFIEYEKELKKLTEKLNHKYFGI